MQKYPVEAAGGKVARAKAVEIIIRDHIESEKIGGLLAHLSSQLDKTNDTLLRAGREKNKNPKVQAYAYLALAGRAGSLEHVAKRIQRELEMAAHYEKEGIGKELLEQLKKSDVAKRVRERTAVQGIR